MNTYSLIAKGIAGGGQTYVLTGGPLAIPEDAGTTDGDALHEHPAWMEHRYMPVLRSAAQGMLSSASRRTAVRNLHGLGREIYSQLVPSELRGLVNQMSVGDALHIYEDKAVVQWELVKNGGDTFWGQLFVMSHSTLTMPGKKVPQDVNLSIRKIVNVIGAGIDRDVAERATALFTTCSPPPDTEVVVVSGEETADPVDALYEHLPTADLVHFTCHGEAGPAGVYLRLAKKESSGNNFMVTSLAAGDVKTGCIVFANACSSFRSTRSIRDWVSFGPRFCMSGANAFIGTLDLVPDYPAVLFAEALYRDFFTGVAIGEALWRTKCQPLTIDGATSLAPLLYSLWGNPRVHARPELP